MLVLANMESYNAILIQQGKFQAERMKLLHELAVQQMTTMSTLDLKKLPGIEVKWEQIPPNLGELNPSISRWLKT